MLAAWQATIVDEAGNIQAGASVQVLLESSGAAAALFSDRDGLSPISNPVIADSEGFVRFYAAGSSYRINATLGSFARTWRHVAMGILAERDVLTETLIRYEQTTAESTAGVAPTNYRYLPGNIRRYGAVVNGTTDDSAALRKALDLAAQDGTTATCDPPGLIKISSTVYIPQRISGEGNKGFLLNFYGSTFVGQGRGTGTIFESGTGTASTGGGTNFGETAESATSIHYGTVIAGARFKSCEIALRLFNWIKGCKLEDLYIEDVDQCLFAQSCFYLELHNVHGVVQSISAVGDVLFDFDGTNNAITIIGCEAGSGVGNVNGIGFRFTGGGAGSAGIIFHGSTAETLARGLVINGSIESIDVNGCYFESCAVAGIDASAAGAKYMTVDNCWFLLTTKAIYATEWVAGRFGSGNYFAGTPDEVDISDDDSRCIVEIPNQYFSEAQSATAVKVPSQYTLGPAVRVIAPRIAYADATGLSAPISVDASVGLKNVPAFAYSDGPTANGASFTVPFCAQTLNSGSSIIDTQINWNAYHMHVYFGMYTEIDGAKYIDGIVGHNGIVRRFDTTANIDVTASNNSGKLRLTVDGSAHTGFTSNGFWGQVRHL